MWCSNPGGGHCVCVNSACSYHHMAQSDILCGVLTQVEVIVFV